MEREVIKIVRDHFWPIASLKATLLVAGLPEARSGKSCAAG
jgi:hypothetical protein